MELRIVSHDGGIQQAVRSVAIGPEGCSFGRGNENSLVLNDPERLVSRNQARIDPVAGGWSLANVSAANIMLVNDHEIAPGERQTIAPGDLIRIGRFVLSLVETGTPVQASMPAGLPVQATPFVDPLAAFSDPAPTGHDIFADILAGSRAPEVAPVAAPTPPAPRAVPQTPPPATPAQLSSGPFPGHIDPGADLFAGLDAPQASMTAIGDATGLPAPDMADLSWSSQTHVGGMATPTATRDIIPADFNPFDLPSLAPRNTDDPLANMATPHIAGLDDLLGSEGAAPENLLDDLPGFSSEGLPDTRAMSAGELPLGASAVRDDPLALFGEASPFAMLDAETEHVSGMRDNTAEIASAFQLPTAIAAPPAPEPVAARPAGTPETAPGIAPAAAVPAHAAPPRVTPAPTPTPAGAALRGHRLPTPGGVPPGRAASPEMLAAAVNEAKSQLITAFLEGAGLQDQSRPELTPEFMRLMGELLAIAAQGTVDLMQARAATKHELRAQVTMIAPQKNNPLKFAPDGQAAMAQLVGKRFPGFMPPLDAMRDAFNDLRAHQVGMTAGMRAALREVLQRYSPEQLEQRITRQSLIESLLPAARKSRLWDLYIEMYQQIKSEAEDEFDSVFGDAFLKSYDEEVARLTQRGNQ